MSKRLYAGNLSFELSSEDLASVFNQYGKVVSSEVIINKFNGKSKGYGFVEMDSEENAQKAIESLNGSDVKGRPIVVNLATEKKSFGNSTGRRFGGNGSGGNRSGGGGFRSGSGGGFRSDRGGGGGFRSDRGGGRGGRGDGGFRSDRGGGRGGNRGGGFREDEGFFGDSQDSFNEFD